MEEIVFYDVKTRQKVSVPHSDIKRTTFERTSKNGTKQVRYGLRAVYEGRKLVKFISKDVYDSLDLPSE